MTMSDDGNHNVVHEAEAQRQHVRVRLPGIVELASGNEKLRFRLHDISAGGFAFEATGGKTFKVGEVVRGNLVLNVDAIAIALAVKFQVRNFDAGSGRAGVQFLDLGPKEISTLRRIISAFLAGELVSVGDVLHTLARENYTKGRGGKAGAPVPVDMNARLRSFLLTACFLCAGLVAFTYTMRQANRLLFMTTATAAKVAGPVYTIAMPREGTVTSLVPKDGMVKKGTPIATFETPAFDIVRNQAFSVNMSDADLQRMMGMNVKGTITSPCDCRVQAQFITDAQYVARGQPLFDLMPQEFKPYIVARFRYEQVAHLVEGTEVHFHVAGDSSERFGRIKQVRAPGLGDNVESDVLVTVEPDDVLPAVLMSRPVELAAGRGILGLFSGSTVEAKQ
jgi:alginate biosynthesis protein Alg44